MHSQVLEMPPCPTINAATGSIPNSMMTTLSGTKTPGFRDGHRPLRTSMLSDVDETHTRGAVFILAADDPFWKVSSADELYDVLQRAFPQVRSDLKILHMPACPVTSAPLLIATC